MSGTLFVVGTPIGNLEDLTFRALRTLKEVDLIAAEDTRRTSRLLAHYGIRRPLVSLHEHNERRETPRIIDRLTRGESVALVTDAGTPGIADPGARLVEAVHNAGLKIVPIPGPSAVITALSASGFSADEFSFMGFPPASGTERERWFQRLKADPRIVVLFEAPHRIQRTLKDLALYMVTRPIIAMREMTKIHEQLVKLPLSKGSEKPASDTSRGEFTIVIGPDVIETSGMQSDKSAAELFGRLIDKAGLSEEMALMIMDKTFHMSASSVRKAIKRHSIWVKQQNAHTP